MDDPSIIRILVAPPNASETPEEALVRNEKILGTLFCRLSPVESRGMWLRISRERSGDQLSEVMARLPNATRQRLMALLLDERRLKPTATS